MRFTLLALMIATAYFALAFFSISNSTSRYWSEGVRSGYGMIFAFGLIYGYDRQHTPAIAFGIVGFTLAYYVRLPTYLISNQLDHLGFSKSAPNHLSVIQTVNHHFSMLVAFMSFLVAKRFSLRQRVDRTKDR